MAWLWAARAALRPASIVRSIVWAQSSPRVLMVNSSGSSKWAGLVHMIERTPITVRLLATSGTATVLRAADALTPASSSG